MMDREEASSTPAQHDEALMSWSGPVESGQAKFVGSVLAGLFG